MAVRQQNLAAQRVQLRLRRRGGRPARPHGPRQSDLGLLYRRLISLLAGQGRRAVALDHLGCGLSDKPPETQYDYSLDSRIFDLTAFVSENIPREPIDLIVHDWGGMIGLGWAVDHPERVRKIVLLNTAAFVLPPDRRFEALRRFSKVPKAAEWLVRDLGTFEKRTAAFGVSVSRCLPPCERGI